MVNYKLTEEAKTDLRRIYMYGFRTFGEARADAYYNELFDRFEKIAEIPYFYPAVDDVRKNYRRSVCGVDNIYYRIIDGLVEISTILGRQDPEQHS